MKKSRYQVISLLAVVLLLAYYFANNVFVYAPNIGQAGGPIEGLTAAQLRKFLATQEIFKHEFTPEEGLGPVFNGRSCFECHGQSTVMGGEGRDVTSTGVVRIGRFFPNSAKAKLPKEKVMTTLTRADVDLEFFSGGPALQRKSITSEFPKKYPADCQIEIATVPEGTDFISLRHAPPLFGFGLIEAIPDQDILRNVFNESKISPRLAGRVVSHTNPLTNQIRVGRFGWKNQNPNLMMFTAEALNVEMGVTTFMQDFMKSASGISSFPQCIIKYLPTEPNDLGKVTNQLTYFQALLAPPARGPVTAAAVRGEKIFEKLQCAVCHLPEMQTASVVYIVDPYSAAPKLQYLEVKALESKPVRAYSDFLLHQMGPGLADGLPQQGATGGEWRTTPLWGLRNKKFLLHDGRTTDISEAILAHGGQAESVVGAYNQLPDSDRADLLSFLKSL